MSEHNINHLGKVVQEILDVLRKFMKEIMDALNVLKRLPTLFSDLRDDLNKGFHNLIQAQAEMEIYIRMAGMKSKKSLVIAENEAISDFESQLKEDLQEIDQRYTRINDDLEDQCKKRIEEIDLHLLDLPNKFPQDLYTTYQKELLPLFENLIKDNSISYSHRMTALKNAAEKTSLVVNRFISVRNDFSKQVKAFEIPEEVSEVKTFHVPLWIMEIKTGKNGDIVRKAVLPSEMVVAKGAGIQSQPKLILEKGLKNLEFVQNSERTHKRIFSSFNWKQDVGRKEKLAKDFEKYFQRINPNKQVMVKDAVAKAIRRSNLQSAN